LRATLEEEKEEDMLTVEDKQYKQLVGQGIIIFFFLIKEISMVFIYFSKLFF
jgi:hypothetical protein